MNLFTEWVSLVLISNCCLYGIRIHVQMLSLTTIEASCQGSMTSAIFYRKTATGNTFENIVKVVNDDTECETKTVLSKTAVQCLCKDRNQVRCVISEITFHYSDEWYCAIFTNGSLVNSDSVSMSKQDIILDVQEVSSSTDATTTVEVSPTITDEMTKFNSIAAQTAGTVENVTETPKFDKNATVLFASVVGVGFVFIAAVISTSVFVYRKCTTQSAVVKIRRTPIAMYITSISDCSPEIHTNARQGEPTTSLQNMEVLNYTDSLDGNSEPSSTESATSHYEIIPTQLQSGKSGSDDEPHINIRSSLADNTVSKECSGVGIHQGNIFQSVQIDTIADITLITDIAEGTEAIRKRGSDEFRYESLM
ncbi:uncharacterized protein LOC127882281 [Dreissena polymorpha]|uniref:Uncharacterized protein n=1 Tax=Dreissena polymorpha TaxID=45954 RepID=A0A9D4H1U4_DREPO|nr:uncharacterized protein LOC127882281 [Dreissena polymorpha]KAH3825491.1 hypothetical protein DPMN_127368 [Dreissena polymorpha]